MKSIPLVGSDLAKNTFQLHGVDAEGRVVLRRMLGSDQVATFFANLPPAGRKARWSGRSALSGNRPSRPGGHEELTSSGNQGKSILQPGWLNTTG